MGIHPDATPFEQVLERLGGGLLLVPGDDDSGNFEIPFPAQIIDEFEDINIVGNAEIGPHFAVVDIGGMNTEDDVGFIFKLLKETDFDIGVEVGKHSGRMVIKDEFPPELQVKFVVELAHTVENLGRLLSQVLIRIKRWTSAGHHEWRNLLIATDPPYGSATGSADSMLAIPAQFTIPATRKVLLRPEAPPDSKGQGSTFCAYSAA
jgi:hypothetical protein